MRAYLSALSLRFFRNYRDLEVRFSKDESCVLLGPNGIGKTNFLEAISLLVPGHGLRNASSKDFCQVGSADQEWSISSLIFTSSGFVEIKKSAGERRDKGFLSSGLQIFFVTPSMDTFFSGLKKKRRDYLDHLMSIFFSGYASYLRMYEKMLAERFCELRSDRPDARLLEVLENDLAMHASILGAMRLDFIDLVMELIKEKDFGFAPVRFWFEGSVEQRLQESSALEVEEYLRREFFSYRDRDALLGGAHVGIHRSDFCGEYASVPGNLCSMGEQKVLFLHLFFSAVSLYLERKGSDCILLLDELPVHLDKENCLRVAALLREMNCQFWMTGTDVSSFEFLAHQANFLNLANFSNLSMIKTSF